MTVDYTRRKDTGDPPRNSYFSNVLAGETHLKCQRLQKMTLQLRGFMFLPLVADETHLSFFSLPLEITLTLICH